MFHETARLIDNANSVLLFSIQLILLIRFLNSTGKKDKATRHLKAVCYHHDYNDGSKSKPKFVHGFVHVEVHTQIGPIGFTWDTRLYLRECNVRKLNRQREPEKRLHYRSKYALAHAMLEELAELLPKGYKVYVLFDSWYSSARLIKFSRQQGWRVVCAINSNRRINKKRVDLHDLALKHKHYQKVVLQATDPHRPAPVYYVRTVTGQLENVSAKACAILQKAQRGSLPQVFCVYRPQLVGTRSSECDVLYRQHQRRWPVEVDNSYLQKGLGLADFRLQSFEATDKWFAVTLVSLNYLHDISRLKAMLKLPHLEPIRITGKHGGMNQQTETTTTKRTRTRTPNNKTTTGYRISDKS